MTDFTGLVVILTFITTLPTLLDLIFFICVISFASFVWVFGGIADVFRCIAGLSSKPFQQTTTPATAPRQFSETNV